MIVITGPTATGKTKLAAYIAHTIGGEIISADSRQVFKEMNLGTGKDLEDYKVGDVTIPYHLIDTRFPGDTYSVYDFVTDYKAARGEILARGKNIILCGGTGLYIEAVLEGYQLPYVPVNQELRNILRREDDNRLIAILASMKPLHNVTDISNRDRLIRAIEIETWKKEHPIPKEDIPPYIIIGITMERQALRKRITDRLHKRLEHGMVDEVRGLIDKGLPFDKLDFYGLEYRYVGLYLMGKLTYEEMFSKLNTAIHQFAKRQETWFRRMGRKGFKIYWLDAQKPQEILFSEAMDLIKQHKNEWDEINYVSNG